MKRCLVAVLLAVSAAFPSAQANQTMTAHYFEVGQAHATLLEFPCGTMLIDAGAQDDRTAKHLVESLKEFFDEHPDRDSTIDLLLITHNHIDHTYGLDAVRENFKINRFIDQGIENNKGSPPINRLKAAVKTKAQKTVFRTIRDSEVNNLNHKNGLTDSFIDPFDCPGVDPSVRILNGRLTKNPGWTNDEFKNLNNHSLVTRVDYGDSSFLFMGDAETPLYSLLIDYYNGAAAEILDADVIQIGHHGAANGTSPNLLTAVSPKIAVLPVGHWSFGRNSKGPFNTYSYGHPRKVTIDALAGAIDRERSEALQVMVGLGQRKFQKTWVSKAIYATDWDGNIRIVAKPDGSYVVRRSHIE